jgi:Uma2 family endonuclease
MTEEQRIALALPELRCTFGGRSIVPDIAVFTWSRIPTNPDGTIANQFNNAPDWIIEILSPSQSVTRVMQRILHCIEYGTTLAWLIDPQEKLVLVYAATHPPQYFEAEQHCLPVPDFAQFLTLTLGQIWAWLHLTPSS